VPANLKPLVPGKTIVKVSQPDSFQGIKLALYTGECKYNDGGLKVFLIDKEAPYKDVCIQIDRGDTIESVQE
jgi:hypothetical protein